MSKSNKGTTYVYLLTESGLLGRWKKKVGIGIDPEKRLTQLQTGNPDTISILFALPLSSRKQALEVEAHVHRLLKILHIRGEWFYFPPALDVVLMFTIWLIVQRAPLWDAKGDV